MSPWATSASCGPSTSVSTTARCTCSPCAPSRPSSSSSCARSPHAPWRRTPTLPRCSSRSPPVSCSCGHPTTWSPWPRSTVSALVPRTDGPVPADGRHPDAARLAAAGAHDPDLIAVRADQPAVLDAWAGGADPCVAGRRRRDHAARRRARPEHPGVGLEPAARARPVRRVRRPAARRAPRQRAGPEQPRRRRAVAARRDRDGRPPRAAQRAPCAGPTRRRRGRGDAQRTGAAPATGTRRRRHSACPSTRRCARPTARPARTHPTRSPPTAATRSARGSRRHRREAVLAGTSWRCGPRDRTSSGRSPRSPARTPRRTSPGSRARRRRGLPRGPAPGRHRAGAVAATRPACPCGSVGPWATRARGQRRRLPARRARHRRVGAAPRLRAGRRGRPVRRARGRPAPGQQTAGGPPHGGRAVAGPPLRHDRPVRQRRPRAVGRGLGPRGAGPQLPDRHVVLGGRGVPGVAARRLRGRRRGLGGHRLRPRGRSSRTRPSRSAPSPRRSRSGGTLPDGVDPPGSACPEGFVFLFVFDYLSTFERKNPLGLVEAFSRAFAPGEGPVARPQVASTPTAGPRRPSTCASPSRSDRTSTSSRTTWRPTSGTRSSRRATATSRCTAAEGLGLTIAEAMACGKPVIATAYSGNLQFMTDENSFLVPWTPDARSRRTPSPTPPAGPGRSPTSTPPPR